MSFLDELRRCLERPDTVACARLGMGAHRKALLDALDDLEARGTSPDHVGQLHAVWGDKLASFVQGMQRHLVQGLAVGAPVQVVAALVDVALRRRLGLSDSAGTVARDRELDRLSRDVLFSMEGPTRPLALWPERYALEVRAVCFHDDRFVVTELGRRVLDLPDFDAVCRLLAAEVALSRGDSDPWRLSRASAAQIVRRNFLRIDWYGNETSPASMQTLDRLAAFGVFTYEDELDDVVRRYDLTDQGRDALAEVCRDDSALVRWARSSGSPGTRDEACQSILDVLRRVAPTLGASFSETDMFTEFRDEGDFVLVLFESAAGARVTLRLPKVSVGG